MKNKKQLQKYFNHNKSENYKKIMSEIRKEEKMKRYKLLKAVITAILTLLGITGTVLAGSKIYNENIKKHSEIDVPKLDLVVDENGVESYTSDFTDKYMKYDEESNTYYKVITNTKDYSIFKSKENRLPDMSNDDFNDKCLVIVYRYGISMNAHENDLTIVDVTSDEKSTHIILEQKENPDTRKGGQLLCAIVDKSLIKEKIHIEQKLPDITPKGMIKLNELPKDYSVEDALKDNCFVLVDNKVISQNKYTIEYFIRNAKNNEGTSIRIYSRDSKRNINYIHDFTYLNGLFYVNHTASMDNGYKDTSMSSGRYIKKFNSSDGLEYIIQDVRQKNYLEGSSIIPLVPLH